METNFCIIPFIHLNIGPRDEITPCCQWTEQIIKPSGNISHVDQLKVSDTILKTWNSSKWKNLRKSFLNNERPQACFGCWEEEDAGHNNRWSYRMYANNDYEYLLPARSKSLTPAINQKINLTSMNSMNSLIEKLKTPSWLELKLGAKCNLACRICSYGASNKWLTENAIYTLAIDRRVPFEDISREDQKKWSAKKQQESAWIYTDKFWDELKSISKGIRRLDFTGGEPLLIVEHYQYLEWCVEQGYAENIYLDYITNGTVDLTDKIKNLWNNFKFVNMNISMDAYGKLAEYIRTGIDWEHSKKNILEYNEYFKSTNAFNVLAKTRHIKISPTISSYNVYYIDELFLWCEEQNIEVDFNILHTPYNSSIKYLPPFAKTEAIKKLNKYILKHNNDDYGGANTNDVKALINFINSSPDRASKTFSAMIKEQEKIYKLAHNKIMDYEKSFPEWWRILNE